MINWWKARKVFKRPKCHFIFGKDLWFFGLYINPKFYKPIIHIKYSSLGWKTKWDEYRHEWDPYFQIVLFRKWHFIWIFNWIDIKDETTQTSSMATWEAILDYNNGKSDNISDMLICGDIIEIYIALTEYIQNKK